MQTNSNSLKELLFVVCGTFAVFDQGYMNPLPQVSGTKFHYGWSQNISNKNNRLKNPKWREASQLAIYKDDRGAVSIEKQLKFNGQGMTWARDLRISSPMP